MTLMWPCGGISSSGSGSVLMPSSGEASGSAQASGARAEHPTGTHHLPSPQHWGSGLGGSGLGASALGTDAELDLDGTKLAVTLEADRDDIALSLIHISEPTRRTPIS